MSDQIERDANLEDFMIDVVPGPHSIRSGKSTASMFHDVFIPSFGEIPESSPLKQFTATEGTQMAESYLRNPSKVTDYNWPRYDRVNRYIMTTTR